MTDPYTGPARFWADDFDMDLPRIIPRLDDVLGDTAGVRLWTHGHTSHGRLNHPSVWNGGGASHGAFLCCRPASLGSPAGLLLIDWFPVVPTGSREPSRCMVPGSPLSREPEPGTTHEATDF